VTCLLQAQQARAGEFISLRQDHLAVSGTFDGTLHLIFQPAE
jgi:hypothetical protein